MSEKIEDRSRVPIELRDMKVLRRAVFPPFGQEGVYFLCSGLDILYVGQTRSLFKRLGDHLNDKSFDEVFVIHPTGDLRASMIESVFISALRPPLNTYVPKRSFSLDEVAPIGSLFLRVFVVDGAAEARRAMHSWWKRQQLIAWYHRPPWWRPPLIVPVE